MELTIEQQIETLVNYLKVKLDQEDYHGVRDCCVDIEVLKAKLEVWDEVQRQRSGAY